MSRENNYRKYPYKEHLLKNVNSKSSNNYSNDDELCLGSGTSKSNTLLFVKSNEGLMKGESYSNVSINSNVLNNSNYTNYANKQQRNPQNNSDNSDHCSKFEGSLWDLVIKDMKERDNFGISKYKTSLKPHNGRDALLDAYQEALDLCVYLRQALYERDTCSKN